MQAAVAGPRDWGLGVRPTEVHLTLARGGCPALVSGRQLMLPQPAGLADPASPLSMQTDYTRTRPATPARLGTDCVLENIVMRRFYNIFQRFSVPNVLFSDGSRFRNLVDYLWRGRGWCMVIVW